MDELSLSLILRELADRISDLREEIANITGTLHWLARQVDKKSDIEFDEL